MHIFSYLKRSVCQFVFLFFSIMATSCGGRRAPSNDVEENRFYSAYRDIYRAYTNIPVDSTNRQLETYLKEFPENANAWAFYGNTCFRLGKDSEATLAYQKAIQVDDGKAYYYSALGTVFNAGNELDSAEKYLLKALALNDSSPFTFLNLSMLYLKRHDRGKSIAFADSSFFRNRSAPLILAGLSYIYFALSEPEKGNEMYGLAKQNGLKDTTRFDQVLRGEVKIDDYYRINSY